MRGVNITKISFIFLSEEHFLQALQNQKYIQVYILHLTEQTAFNGLTKTRISFLSLGAEVNATLCFNENKKSLEEKSN